MVVFKGVLKYNSAVNLLDEKKLTQTTKSRVTKIVDIGALTKDIKYFFRNFLLLFFKLLAPYFTSFATFNPQFSLHSLHNLHAHNYARQEMEGNVG